MINLVNHCTKSYVGLWQEIPHASNISNTSRPIPSHSLLSISPFPLTVCYIWNKHLIYLSVGVIMILQQRGSYRTKVAANPNSIKDSTMEHKFADFQLSGRFFKWLTVARLLIAHDSIVFPWSQVQYPHQSLCQFQIENWKNNTFCRQPVNCLM